MTKQQRKFKMKGRQKSLLLIMKTAIIIRTIYLRNMKEIPEVAIKVVNLIKKEDLVLKNVNGKEREIDILEQLKKK